MNKPEESLRNGCQAGLRGCRQPVNVCHYPELAMKKATCLVLFCVLASVALLAQVPTDSPVDVLRHPGWNGGVFVGGGTTVDSSPSGQKFGARGSSGSCTHR